MLQVRCPDGRYCPDGNKCCPTTPPGTRQRVWVCCAYGPYSKCCSDYRTCCPRRWTCVTLSHECVRQTHSHVLRVPAILLVNSTDKRCRDGTAGMDPKVSSIIPSQQVETALKRSAFIDTSGDALSPDQKYQCPDGTTICVLFSGIYSCCPNQNAR